MDGLVHINMQRFIRSEYGDQQWQRIMEQSGLHKESFITDQCYADDSTTDLMRSATDVLNIPMEQLLNDYGLFWLLNQHDEAMDLVVES